MLKTTIKTIKIQNNKSKRLILRGEEEEKRRN
jgi:hypothetical protein